MCVCVRVRACMRAYVHACVCDPQWPNGQGCCPRMTDMRGCVPPIDPSLATLVSELSQMRLVAGFEGSMHEVLRV